MSTPLSFGRDLQGYNAYAPMPSTNKYAATLVANGASAIVVPSNFQTWVVAFSTQPGADIWVDFTGATAIVPVGATLATTTSELNPGQRTLQAGDSISVITANVTADISIQMWPTSYA